jgi:hypothetical protein
MDRETRDRLRSTIESATDVEPRGGSLRDVERRVARRRPLSVVGLAATVVMVTAMSFVAGEAALRNWGAETSADGDVAPAQRRQAESPPERRGERRVIASGTRNGRGWELRGFRAEDAQGPRPLCLEWVHPPVDTGGTACTTDLLDGLPPDELVISQTVDNPFFGEVAPEVETLEIHSEDGVVTQARIVDAPGALDVPYHFFVGFSRGSGDMTLVAKDADGNVLERETHAALPLLVVTRDGEGAGRVTGYSTDEARCGAACPAPTRWIDCGDVCVAELDGATITLEAEPEEGSVFVGWSGACEGGGPCTITVDSDSDLVATFEEAP